MNKCLAVFFLLIFFSCGNTDRMKVFKATKTNLNVLNVGFKLDFSKPSNFDKNLKMFSTAELGVKMKIYDMSDNLLSEDFVIRRVKYDRWNDIYSIKDSFSNTERTFTDFQSLEKSIYDFSNIFLTLKNGKDKKNFLLKYDFYFLTVDFAQPFKFIEFYIKTDNMQSKNNKKYFYVENN